MAELELFSGLVTLGAQSSPLDCAVCPDLSVKLIMV